MMVLCYTLVNLTIETALLPASITGLIGSLANYKQSEDSKEIPHLIDSDEINFSAND